MPGLTTSVTLLAPHRHAGRDYPMGACLALPAASAEWLIGLGRATRAEAADPAPPASEFAAVAPPCLDCEPAPPIPSRPKRKE